ncbi:uncharacterized protein FA14DRAFT_176799 [Meira miltonrushii]|uniref:Heat shock factor binding protein 1 n=1 Tax=Meira miltonrushii TaxID=1280837 RepID=A0A316VIM0_9BASI|nr:uncharacterized protein FA14DRAFT_176799 [Meira miltonrushii]PWN37507.1 hypothetical protein FA14DRAFT_176799 [Meira miltonrushii]
MTTLPPLQTASTTKHSGNDARFGEGDSNRNNEAEKQIFSSDMNTNANSSTDHAATLSNNHTSTKDANIGFNDSSISSPHELTDWVDNVLDQLESRFSVMSGQVESRMKEMSERIDALESSIEELITGASTSLRDQSQ